MELGRHSRQPFPIKQCLFCNPFKLMLRQPLPFFAVMLLMQNMWETIFLSDWATRVITCTFGLINSRWRRGEGGREGGGKERRKRKEGREGKRVVPQKSLSPFFAFEGQLNSNPCYLININSMLHFTLWGALLEHDNHEFKRQTFNICNYLLFGDLYDYLRKYSKIFGGL